MGVSDNHLGTILKEGSEAIEQGPGLLGARTLSPIAYPYRSPLVITFEYPIAYPYRMAPPKPKKGPALPATDAAWRGAIGASS